MGMVALPELEVAVNLKFINHAAEQAMSLILLGCFVVQL
jgi:hypothetical protein